MKTTFKSAIGFIIFTMLFAWSSIAQEPAYRQAVSKSSSPGFSRSLPSKTAETHMIGIEKINPKVLSRFNKNFSDATNVKWEQLGNNFLAIFDKAEATTRSLFDKKGRIIYTIINYSSEKQLPSDIKNLVTNKYDDYLIIGVAKVLQDNREIWVVRLSGQFHYKLVRLENKEMEEVENFQKTN